MAASKFDIECPSCGHKFQEAIERLMADLTATCPGCGGVIDVHFRDEHGLETTTQVGELQVTQSARGSVTYAVEVFNRGLNKHRFIRGPDPGVLQEKVRCQVAEWNEMWAKRAAAKRQATAAGRKAEEAAERTADAQSLLDRLGNLLAVSLGIDATPSWDDMKNKAPFPEPRPEMPRIDAPPFPKQPRAAPDRTFGWYQPKLGLLDKLIPSRKRERTEEASNRFQADLRAWEQERDRLASEFQAELAAHQAKEAERRRAHAEAVSTWEGERAAYGLRQAEQHAAIDNLRHRYNAKDPEAIVEYCKAVLTHSEYPDCVPMESQLEFSAGNGVLIVDLKLPAPADLPTLSEVKYVQSGDSFAEKHLSEAQQAKLYDELLYQITLRTVRELFQSDRVGAIAAIVINGVVTSTDRGTGKQVTACVLSVQASRDVFAEINLSKVDPKACFRQLKGVGSSKLHSITPVAPIMQMRRDDRRFIPSHGVAGQLHEGFNLATMDWEEFEHLIREIFEREFSSAGGEVRVTQASRDGGVDAVAFDPDPIRGGKIVIQAKRYAHTVGVAAVRDLFGTVMNEGATKGILVTTSDYGPDAYEFANGKPITLMNGSNLLHLLEKHGTKAHIDLLEARQASRA